MNQYTELIERYFAAWNETDATQRRGIIARTWTDAASYIDPLMQATGHENLDAMIAGVQTQFPGYRFHQLVLVDAFQDRLRFSWELIAPGGDIVITGTDFGIVAPDGRLQTMTGFLDSKPEMPSESV